MVGAMEYQAGKPGLNASVVTYFFLLFFSKILLSLGRYKQWNGLLEWNTGLDYWTELFSFFGHISEFIFGCLLLMIYKYLATMDDCNNDNHCLLQCFHK